MNKRIALNEMSPLIRETLESGKEVVFTITGDSMRPLFRHRRDKVCIVKQQKELLDKYDIPFYIREDGKYIIHRIVSVKDGKYTLIGDNQWAKEYPVLPTQVLGVVKGFWRNETYIPCDNKWYKVYSKIWVALYPFRWVFLRFHNLIKKGTKLLHRRHK